MVSGRSRGASRASDTWASTAGPAPQCSSTASSPAHGGSNHSCDFFTRTRVKTSRHSPLMNPRVPEHIDRGCVGPGRRRDTGRGLWAAGRWSLRPAGGAVCSRWGSGTWAAPLNSSTPSPAAPPSSDCQTTCQTGEDMKEKPSSAVSAAWFLTVSFSSRWDHCEGALGASSFICSHIPTLLEGFVSLQTPTMRQQWQRLTTIVSRVFSFKVFSCLIFWGTWYLWKTNTVKQKTRKWADVVQASTVKQSRPVFFWQWGLSQLIHK